MDKIDFDLYGHCVSCHENLMMEQAIGGKLIKRFKPKQTFTSFVMSDGSNMKVMICKKCLKSLDEKKEKEIMECVVKGWEYETNILVADQTSGWNQERKDRYMDKYSKLEIAFHDKNFPNDVKEIKLQEFKDKKNGISK